MPAVDLLLTPLAFFVAVLIWGVLPGAAIRLIVRLYPKGHERRKELVSEVYAVPIWERPFWVASQLELGLVEGVTLRHDRARRKSRGRLAVEAGAFADSLGTGFGVGPLVISMTEERATTDVVAALSEVLIRHSGGNEVRLKLVGGPSARLFEIPYPVRISADLYGELRFLLGPNCLR